MSENARDPMLPHGTDKCQCGACRGCRVRLSFYVMTGLALIGYVWLCNCHGVTP